MGNQETTDQIEAGRVIAGRYRILRRIGGGAVGAVYEVEHIALQRRAALKVLREKFFGNSKMLERFIREARAAAAIRHPGIVEVFDLGNAGGISFIVMELLEGEELISKVKRDHPLPVDFVLQVGLDLVDAVVAAHEQGVIHRDLKPQNVFLARERRSADVVKVLDFGLAKVVNDKFIAALTKSGDVFGSPVYMSPEQLHNAKDVDGRVDVYAIGVILYEALAGVPPFRAKELYDLVVKIASEPPQPLSEHRDDIPSRLEALVNRALAKKRDDRQPSAQALFEDLQSCRNSHR